MRIRFDTRDKKPKLYLLLGLTAAAALAVTGLMLRDETAYALPVLLILDVYFAAALILLIRAWVGQLQYNPYSYNTIFYFGFGLLDLSVLISHIAATVRLLRLSEGFEGVGLLHWMAGSAANFMLLSSPFILLFSAALCVSNIALMRHEGKRPVNLLGILLAVLLVGGEILYFRFTFYVSGSQLQVMLHDLGANVFAAVYLYFECMILGAIVADAIAARHEPEKDRDFVIILGCGIREDGTPTPLLRGRIDRALEFDRRQQAETGKVLTFVTSGGQGPDEVISESECMKRYLMAYGVAEERILQEDRSASTFENMLFSRAKILERDPDGKIAFSTTNYHVFRSGLFARRVKMRAVGMGAETRWYFWPNAAVREFVGLLTEHRGKQALIFGGMIAAYIALTLLIYR
ncbi:MAG: YdcF family protein [Oscillospiraceae bacterium]|nr:YdcF family protein [Oscillospiraceae bacterium]